LIVSNGSNVLFHVIEYCAVEKLHKIKENGMKKDRKQKINERERKK